MCCLSCDTPQVKLWSAWRIEGCFITKGWVLHSAAEQKKCRDSQISPIEHCNVEVQHGPKLLTLLDCMYYSAQQIGSRSPIVYEFVATHPFAISLEMLKLCHSCSLDLRTKEKGLAHFRRTMPHPLSDSKLCQVVDREPLFVMNRRDNGTSRETTRERVITRAFLSASFRSSNV